MTRRDLAELAHQVILGVQAAGGVDDEHVDLAGLGGVDGVVDDGAGIGALPLADDLDAQPLAPDGELLDGGGAEGVAGGEHHPLALLLSAAGELGDRGRLADAVDAHHQGQHGTAAEDARAGHLVEHVRHLVGEQLAQLGGARRLLLEGVLLDALDQLQGGVDPEVGADEHLFEVFERAVVESDAVAHRIGDLAR